MKRTLSFVLALLLSAVALAAPSEALLFSLPAPTSRTNVEVIDGQVTFAPGDLAAGDELQIEVLGAQEGTTDLANLRVRLGTMCTTSDINLNAFIAQFLSAANHSGGKMLVFKVLSNTTIQRIGGANESSFYPGLTQNQVPTTIPDVSTNTNCLSVAVVTNGTTDPVKLQGLRIRIVKP